jgi:hypothetical protein
LSPSFTEFFNHRRSSIVATIIVIQLLGSAILLPQSCEAEKLVWRVHCWWSTISCLIRVAIDQSGTSVVFSFTIWLLSILRASAAPIPAVLALIVASATALLLAARHRTGKFDICHVALPYRLTWVSLYALVACQAFSGCVRVGNHPWPAISPDDVLVSFFRAHHWRNPVKNIVLVCLPLFTLHRCEQYISQRRNWLDPDTMLPQIGIVAMAIMIADSSLTQLTLGFAVILCSVIVGHAVRWKRAVLKML